MSVKFYYTTLGGIVLLPIVNAFDHLTVFISVSVVMFILFLCCALGSFYFCRGRRGPTGAIGWGGRRNQCNYDPVAMSLMAQAMQQQQTYPNTGGTPYYAGQPNVPYQQPMQGYAYPYPQQPPLTTTTQSYPGYPQQPPTTTTVTSESTTATTQSYPIYPPPPETMQSTNLPYPPAQKTADIPAVPTAPYASPPSGNLIEPPQYFQATSPDKKY